MNRLKNFWLRIYYNSPKPIRWLLDAIQIILALGMFIMTFEILLVVGVLCFEIIPNKLQVLGGGWALVIELVFVFPLFLAVFYGIIWVYIKIFKKE